MWKLYLTLGGLNGKTTRLAYELVAANYADASDARAAIMTVLNDITDSVIQKSELVEVEVITDSTGGDIFEVAAIVARLTTAGKTAVLNVPAPNIGIFQSAVGHERDQVDTNDGALLDYVTQLAAVVKVSDGETLAGTVKSGRRVTRKLSA